MPQPPYTANHGFVAVIDPHACNDVMDRPRIELFVAYNLADDEKSLGDALGGHCQQELANPTTIVSAGFPVYECPPRANSALQQSSYVVLYGAQQGRGGIAIHVDLYAHPYAREADLATARQLRTSIRWHSPSLEDSNAPRLTRTHMPLNAEEGVCFPLQRYAEESARRDWGSGPRRFLGI
jgi:hypothetical protein